MGTDIHGVWQRWTGGKWTDIESTYEQGRHYQLFAVLAGVRNGRGFAGVKTGEEVTPIADPRGLPDDFEVEDDHHNGTWMGDHSHSWLGGKEMLKWFADPPVVRKCGVITRDAYAAWDGVSEPAYYCGIVMGKGLVTVENDESVKDATPNWTHVRVRWTEKLAEKLAYFFDEVEKLTRQYDRIRFVFGFDS